MPNRIIKESIHTSETINRLTDWQFRLWVSLITYVDDYGRGDARPAIIKGACFPLRERLSLKDIDDGLHALAGAGCVDLYEVDGKPYLCFPSWAEHQRIQTKRSRYPEPPQSAAFYGNPPLSTVSHREPPPESNPNPNTNPNPIQSEERAQSKPSLDEVISYVKERRSGVNAKRFFEYHEARGWKGITDWKAALRSWESNGIDKQDATPASYDIERAELKAKTGVPTLKKRTSA